jgi:uncharacterized protein (TIGR03085 family)
MSTDGDSSFMSTSRRERAQLVATLHAVGPEAPTLCEGWTTRDLAAHLVVRERRLDAMVGVAFGPLAGYTAKVQKQLAETTDWHDLVEKVSAGPPVYSPFRLLDPLVNGIEMFIHHEDVRRATPGWVPRDLDAQTVSTLRRAIPLISRIAMTKVPARVTLCTNAGQKLASVGHGPDVTVTGAIEELVLFAVGRNAIRATFTGNDDDVAAVLAAPRGL